jgi:hypothetical protein
MDNKKFEKLIDLIINENEEQARALFHDIVVEKSREIYESMMDEEMTDSPVDGLLDEISYEEQGMTEEEDEFADIEMDDGEGDMEVDLDSDEMGDEEGEGDLENRVVDLEDKLDELMAEFEELMGQEDGKSMGDDGDMGDEMMEAKDEDEESLEESQDDEEDTLEESTNLIAVKNPVHGDNGQNAKSIVSSGSKVSANGAKAVNFTSGDGGKGGTQGGLLNPATKDVKGAGQFKNAPGKNNFSEKGEAAPKPTAGDNGQNTKSITSESRKITKKIVK